MSEPLFPALHVFASAARLRPGATVRVRLAAEPAPIEGVLRAIDSRGVSVEERRPFFLTAADWSADRPQFRRARWAEMDGVWVRSRAVASGVLWAAVLALAFGWCGHQADQLTDGFPRAELIYVGLVCGLVIGGGIMLLGHEWHQVDPSALYKPGA